MLEEVHGKIDEMRRKVNGLQKEQIQDSSQVL